MMELTPVDIKPEFTDETFRQVLEPLTTGEKDQIVIETLHRRKNGTTYPVEIHLQLQKTGNKSVFLAVINDITERLESNRILHESHERWESLFNNSPNAIAVYQAVDEGNDFVFTDFNLQAQKTENLSRDEVVGKRMTELFPGVVERGFLDVFRKVWRTGKTEYLSSTFYKDNRIEGWRENIIYKLNTGEIVAIYSDVSERMQTEIALRQSEEKFRKLFEEHAASKLIIDPVTGNIVDANKAASAFYGYTKEELTAMNVNQINILSPEAIELKMRKAQTRKRNFFEFSHRLKNGSIKDVAVFSSPIEMDGKEYLHSIVQDITQSKKAEKQLKLLGRAIDQNPVTIIITNTDGDIEYVNPKFTEVTGYSFEEVIGQNPRLLQSGEHDQKFYKELWDTILSGNDWHGEFHNKKKNGEDYWESAIISPVFDDSGKISSFVAVKEDITERKKILHDLIVAKEKAQESDRLKSAFLATMSHELRTPLNAVIGFSSLIDEEMPVEEIVSFAKMINNSGNNLLEIVEGILDLTLLESGEMKPKFERFALALLMKTLMKLAKDEQQKANKPQVEIECNCNFEEQIQLYSDQQLITKIFVHLFRNALKFTSSGKVEFGYMIESNGETDRIKFFVKDTGIGIPENQKAIIFERFRQADGSLTRKYGGAGIGLSIVKHMVGLLGGQIEVDSEPGKGSTFYVTIPVAEPEQLSKALSEQKEDTEKPKTFPNQTILIAEDEDSNFELLKYILIKSNLSIIRARDGQEAVNLCSVHPEISLVLMDINMPKMNGIEATKLIKQAKPKLPVIAVTAFAMSGDREKFIAEGCDEYLEKPIKKDKLLTLLGSFMS
jgi:PAS domain S-box-containing protein